MAGRSGIATQLGIAAESTYGTYVAPARFLEFVDESMALSIARNEAKGLRAGQRVLGTDHWQAGKRAAKGDIQLEIGNKGFGLLLQHMMGTIATTADGTGKKHTATIGDLYGLSLIRADRPAGRLEHGAAVLVPRLQGRRVGDRSGDRRVRDAEAQPRRAGRDDVADARLGDRPVRDGALPLVGLLDDGRRLRVRRDQVHREGRQQDQDRPALPEVVEAEEGADRERQARVHGHVQGEFENLTAYNRFINGTVVPIVCTWTAVATYDTAKPFKLVLTMNNCRFDGSTPNVKNEDLLDITLPFKCLDDYSTAPVQFDYYTSDTTP
jgi:hypothetical protein